VESHTVLIIDDDKEVAESIAMFLEGKGYRALQAHDATEETFSLIEKEQPDVIILDIILPSCDGIEALKRLKANEATREIPVVICSVVRRKKRVVEGLDAGAVDYLTKPFEVEELFARVGSALIMREIDMHAQENERLETLRDVAQAVADEIRGPLEEIRRHVAALGASPEIEETENIHVVESVSCSVEQIDRILERFR
jgi:DNA-binding response OmpR family regulator